MPTMPNLAYDKRIRLCAVLGMAWLALLTTLPMPRAAAQDDEAKDKAAAAPEEPAAEATPAPSPPASPGTTTPEAPRNESMLMWLVRASGLIGVVIFLVSVYFIALVIRLSMEFRMGEAVPPPLIDKLEAAIRDRKFQDAYDACRDDPSFLAKLVRTGVANLPSGRAEAKEAMNVMTEEIVVGMEQRISIIAVIGTLGPMLGLLGTVWGMILAFQAIASSSQQQVQPARLADNIGTALVTTLEGLVVAIPAISSSRSSATGSRPSRWRRPAWPTARSPPSTTRPASPTPARPPGRAPRSRPPE